MEDLAAATRNGKSHRIRQKIPQSKGHNANLPNDEGRNRRTVCDWLVGTMIPSDLFQSQKSVVHCGNPRPCNGGGRDVAHVKPSRGTFL